MVYLGFCLVVDGQFMSSCGWMEYESVSHVDGPGSILVGLV